MALRRLNPWRTSLATRITSAVILITIVTGLVTGTYLKRSLENGILHGQLSNAISNAQQVISFADLQFILSDIEHQPSSIDVFNSLTNITSNNSTNVEHPVVLIPFPGNKNIKLISSSPSFAVSNVSSEIRKAVERKATIQWAKTTIRNINGSQTTAYVVGNRLNAGSLGKFEIYIFYPLTEQEAIFSLINKSLWIAGVILVLLIGTTTTLISRRIIKPIRDAAIVAENFTSGKRDERMVVQGDDEMTRLAISFNEMAVAISQQIHRLENLSALQQRFVSDVSHELRTPLTTIKMASQVINTERESFSPTVSRSAELLQKQIDRFEKLLTDLLELSRFDASAAAVESQPFDVRLTLQRTLDYITSAENDFIRVSIPENPIFVEGDERRIERVLRNLITNAIDHRNGFSIDITVAENESAVAVGVRDYGVGFSHKDAERVFERFWRADPARARHSGGTGLGLAISREDALLHGGKLEAWARPFRGANFVLTLPKNASQPTLIDPLPLIPKGELSTLEGIDEDPDQ